MFFSPKGSLDAVKPENSFFLRQSNGRFVVFQPNASFLTKMTKSLFKANEIGQWNFIMLGNEINMQSKIKLIFCKHRGLVKSRRIVF